MIPCLLLESRAHTKKRNNHYKQRSTKKIMKKLILCFLVSVSFLSCKESADTTNASTNQEPLSGTFTERDEKAKKLYSNMNLFAKEDFSYVKESFAPNFTLKTVGDTAVAAKGEEEAIAYWKQLHFLFKDISFAEGRVHTFSLNNGEVHTAYFGNWTATGKFTNVTFTAPLNVWITWEGDIIISQMDLLDSKNILKEAAAIPAPPSN